MVEWIVFPLLLTLGAAVCYAECKTATTDFTSDVMFYASTPPITALAGHYSKNHATMHAHIVVIR